MKGLQKSMQRVFGNGLEIFVPRRVLEPNDLINGEGELLDPPNVSDRPILTAAPWH